MPKPVTAAVIEKWLIDALEARGFPGVRSLPIQACEHPLTNWGITGILSLGDNHPDACLPVLDAILPSAQRQYQLVAPN